MRSIGKHIIKSTDFNSLKSIWKHHSTAVHSSQPQSYQEDRNMVQLKKNFKNVLVIFVICISLECTLANEKGNHYKMYCLKNVMIYL